MYFYIPGMYPAFGVVDEQRGCPSAGKDISTNGYGMIHFLHLSNDTSL